MVACPSPGRRASPRTGGLGPEAGGILGSCIRQKGQARGFLVPACLAAPPLQLPFHLSGFRGAGAGGGVRDWAGGGGTERARWQKGGEGRIRVL